MAFKHKFKLEINQTKKAHPNAKGKREKTGEAEIPCPVLEDFGIQVKRALDEKTGQPVNENGLPVYDDPIFQWLQDAVVSAVSVKSRNKFNVESGQLKAGMQLAEDFEALTAASARTGEALVLRREARASFENFLRTLNKSDAFVTTMGELFWNSAKVLGTVSEKYINAVELYAGKWIGQLEEAHATRFAPKIAELNDSIANARDVDVIDADMEETAQAQAA